MARMNGAAVMDRRESMSSALTAKDEAALVDSFFLPGGILDPKQDEGVEEGREDESIEMLPAVTRSGDEWHSSAPAATRSGDEWHSSAPAMTGGATSVSVLESEMVLEETEQRNSFWSTSTNHSSSYHHTQPFNVHHNQELAWPLPNEEEPLVEPYIPEEDQEGQVPELLLNPAPSLFAYENSFNVSSGNGNGNSNAYPVAEDFSLVVQEPADRDPLRDIIPFQISEPLGGSNGHDQGCTVKPPPSAQEEEDVRRMVLALSSSLQNVAETSGHNLPEHLVPESPPKIIRRCSSISASRRLTSIPLELPETAGPDDDDNHSTTSSLSSGSAGRKDSPIQLSAHYRPHTTSLLPTQQPFQLPQQPYLYPGSALQHAPPPAAATTGDYHHLDPLPPFKPTTCVPPPPGYQHMAPPKQLQFRAEETSPLRRQSLTIPSPPPPNLTIPSPPPSLSLPSPQGADTTEELTGFSEDDSAISSDSANADASVADDSSGSVLVATGEADRHELDQDAEKPQSGNDEDSEPVEMPPWGPVEDKPSILRRRSTTTTTTLTMVDSPANGHPREITPGSTPARRGRGRERGLLLKEEDDSKGSEDGISNPQEDQVGPEFMIPCESRKTRGKRRASVKLAATVVASTQRPTPSSSQSEWVADAFDFARQLVEVALVLLACMVKEAVKEGIERKFLACDYAVLYLTPVVTEWLMDEFVWLPHFSQGITNAIALLCVCREHQVHSLKPVEDEGPSLRNDPKAVPQPRKKMRAFSGKQSSQLGVSIQPPSPEEQRKQAIHAWEARICHGLLRCCRWTLPVMILVSSMLQTSDQPEMPPCLRLVAAFGLGLLKSESLLSPLAWISASLQIVWILGMHDMQTGMSRLYATEILITSLGWSTLRFMRLCVGTKSKDP